MLIHNLFLYMIKASDLFSSNNHLLKYSQVNCKPINVDNRCNSKIYIYHIAPVGKIKSESHSTRRSMETFSSGEVVDFS